MQKIIVRAFILGILVTPFAAKLAVAKTHSTVIAPTLQQGPQPLCYPGEFCPWLS